MVLEGVEPRVAGIAFGICWDSDVAGDAVQETLLKCIVGIGRLRDAGAFSSWVDTVATRTSIDAARRASRTQAGLGDETEAVGGGDETSPDPIEAVAIRDAVASLPPTQRAVIVLFYWLDKPVSEIAAVMDCGEGTVKSRLARARDSLEKLLGEEYCGRTT